MLPLRRWLFKTLRGLQAVPLWPQTAPHKSTISIRPGVGEGAQHSVCLVVPGGPRPL